MQTKSTEIAANLQADLSRPIKVTIFKSRAAFYKTEKEVSLIEIADMIESQTAADKGELPWLKAGTFGPKKSPKGSLRTNANMLSASGVEVDYDKEKITLEEAEKRLLDNDIAALIYTTPSHSSEKPRWRVLCPFSVSMPPDERERHVARLNGIFDGELDPASYTMSQAFYFGGVGKAKAKTLLVEGGYLDKADDLDAGAVYLSGAKGEAATYSGEKTDLPFDVIDAALMAIPNDDSNPHADTRQWWRDHVASIHHETDGSDEGLALVLTWSAQHGKFDHDATVTLWRSFNRSDGNFRTARSIIWEAERQGWSDPALVELRRLEAMEEAQADFDSCRSPEELEALDLDAFILDLVFDPDDPPKRKATATLGLTFKTPADCAAIPPRPYVVKGLLSEGNVAAVVGAPGSAKSLFSPRMGYAIAQGTDAFGRRTKPGKVFYVAAEDEHGMELRLQALRAEHGEAEDFILVGGVSDLLTKKGDLPALRAAVKEQRPRLVFIDTLAVAFPGLEENTAEGMGRVVAAARSLTKWGAAVVLIHHDTKAGEKLPRGHSLLNGALDVSLYLKRDGNVVMVEPTKNRNGTTEQKLAFRIVTRNVGFDEDGDPITAAMAEETDLDLTEAKSEKLPPTAKAAFSIFRRLLAGADRVAEEDWRNACVSGREVSQAENSKSRNDVTTRAIGTLVGRKLVSFNDGFYYPDGFPAPNPYDAGDDFDECEGK